MLFCPNRPEIKKGKECGWNEIRMRNDISVSPTFRHSKTFLNDETDGNELKMNGMS